MVEINDGNVNSQKRLFEPLIINGMSLKNRIYKAPTVECAAAENGMPTDKTQNFYTRVAKGGSGLIITGYAYVNMSGRVYLSQHGIHADEVIPAWKNTIEAVHGQGAKIIMQISHGGRQISKAAMRGERPAAPSSLPNFLDFYRSRKMSDKEIKEVARDFGSAAARAKEAGFDGVQIHAAGGYLLSSFLSPLMNHRNDDWGGDARRRFRIMEEVYLAVRKAVGTEFPVFAKINMGDLLLFGRGFPDNSSTAFGLERLGLDALEIQTGILENATISHTRGKMPANIMGRDRSLMAKMYLQCVSFLYKPFAGVSKPYIAATAKRLKMDGLKTPILLPGGIRRLSEAEGILSNNVADMIGMARPLLREPNLPNRWLSGDTRDASCDSCNRCSAETAVLGNQIQCYNRGNNHNKKI
ncbi:MAG: NADH:flavin oxidoreductase [Spirochaetes bacterium]|jgi:2,4-dienoyl-CoA reductase-like NADH-dependent reductase (Old Yellow Enzyme family)|nr:NADH:flavin oxidoreductase [Spirochaetota bacterium]